MTRLLQRETVPRITTKMSARRRPTMRLIGILLSPYVRRVAVSLNILKLPFELDEVFVFGEPEVVRRYNPLVRIPATGARRRRQILSKVERSSMRSTAWSVRSGV